MEFYFRVKHNIIYHPPPRPPPNTHIFSTQTFLDLDFLHAGLFCESPTIFFAKRIFFHWALNFYRSRTSLSHSITGCKLVSMCEHIHSVYGV